jgi:hypothetical protein
MATRNYESLNEAPIQEAEKDNEISTFKSVMAGLDLVFLKYLKVSYLQVQCFMICLMIQTRLQR